MAFNPERPLNPLDLFATFNSNDELNGLIYRSPDQGSYSRINGEWEPLADTNNPYGTGAVILCVKPSFIMEFDSRMMYDEPASYADIQPEFGVDPRLNKKF